MKTKQKEIRESLGGVGVGGGGGGCDMFFFFFFEGWGEWWGVEVVENGVEVVNEP